MSFAYISEIVLRNNKQQSAMHEITAVQSTEVLSNPVNRENKNNDVSVRLLLASGSADCTVRLWDSFEGTEFIKITVRFFLLSSPFFFFFPIFWEF